MDSIEIILFIILNIPVIYLSRRNIFAPKSHGFYRFLSWECIAWLLVKNYKFWFDDAFSTYQIFSWLFLFYSLILIIFGFKLLRESGKQNESRKDGTLLEFEKTTELIESGVYKYIRHPMYGSLLFVSWGIYLKNTTYELLIFAILSTIFLFITACIEDKENIDYFGVKYGDYIKRTKMFVPFLI